MLKSAGAAHRGHQYKRTAQCIQTGQETRGTRVEVGAVYRDFEYPVKTSVTRAPPNLLTLTVTLY